jgi:hypothetical protein
VFSEAIPLALIFMFASIVCVGMAFGMMTWVTMYTLESRRAEEAAIEAEVARDAPERLRPAE